MKKQIIVKASKEKQNNTKPVKAGVDEFLDDEYVMGILREMNGLDEDNDTQDDILLEDYPTKSDIFDAICDYEGLPGYGEVIRDWVFEVYNIDLNEID